jgi:hypothetical protein
LMFKVDSIWSVVIRGGVWLIIAMVIIVSSDQANPESSLRSLKANLGFFLMFLILSGGLLYLLFGFAGTPASA